MKRRYVVSKYARKAPPPLTKDRWQGRRVFRGANGIVCEVVASGKMPTEDWPNGSGCSLMPLESRTFGNPGVKP